MAKDKQTPKAKVFTEEEVAKHTTETDCWLIIGGEVYDVSKYLDDHPGGSEVMMEFAGMDGTTMFEDVGHSSEARSTMKDFCIGTLKSDGSAKKQAAGTATAVKSKDQTEGGGLSPVAILFLLLAIACGVYFTWVETFTRGATKPNIIFEEEKWI